MGTPTLPNTPPTTRACPNCRAEMTVTAVTPILFSDGHTNITYKCKGCGSEMKHTFKQSS
jgi:hypothetical protein